MHPDDIFRFWEANKETRVIIWVSQLFPGMKFFLCKIFFIYFPIKLDCLLSTSSVKHPGCYSTINAAFSNEDILETDASLNFFSAGKTTAMLWMCFPARSSLFLFCILCFECLEAEMEFRRFWTLRCFPVFCTVVQNRNTWSFCASFVGK